MIRNASKFKEEATNSSFELFKGTQSKQFKMIYFWKRSKIPLNSNN